MEDNQEKLEVQLTLRDVVRYNFAYANRSGSLWIILLGGTGFLIHLIYQLSAGKSFESYAFSLIFVVFCFLFPFLIYRVAVRSYQNKFAKETRTYRFTPEGFSMETDSSTMKVLWSDVQRVIVDRDGIYLFVSSNAGHLLPERYLAGNDRIRSMAIQLTPPKSKSAGKSRLWRTLAVYLAIFLITFGIVQFLSK